MKITERPHPLISRVEYQSRHHSYTRLADWGNEYMAKPLLSGGQSDLYFAYDENKNQVLFKQINLSNLQTEYDRRAAIRSIGNEINTLKRYHHPNIIECIDALQIEGLPVLVVPYYPSEQLPTVKGRAKDSVGLDISHAERCARVGVQLSQLVHLFYNEGKAHRDIKSSNILCDEEGNIILLDFGLFGELNTPVGLGAIEYRSPYHLHDDYITVEDEIYGTAIVVYELLTGKFPFNEEIMKAGDIVSRHVTIYKAEFDFAALYRLSLISFNQAQELEGFFRKVFVKNRREGIVDPMLFANNLIPALGVNKSIEELSAPQVSLISK